MKKKELFKNRAVVLAIVAVMVAGTSLSVLADWNPEDGHKMHYPQLPDEDGWDVYATAGLSQYGYPEICLADDWMCSETGPVTDIHFWGSWKGGNTGIINGFQIAIHEDIPASQNPAGYSKPGTTLWEQYITDYTAVPIDPQCNEGWYDPFTGEVIYDDHDNYFQYNIVGIIEPFYQTEGTIYWLCISAIVEYNPTGLQALWGWKSSTDHWNDDAVWAEWGHLNWIDLWEPAPPVTNQYWIAMDPAGNPDPAFTGGTDYYDDGHSLNGWYYYPQTDWWNIWFYDHPFDDTRIKEIYTSFNLWKYFPGMPSYVEVAVNWATDLWPPDSPPPLPPDDEPYIGREILLVGQDMEGFFEFFYEILDYNPEWVSIDVRGYNFVIENGYIEHACLQSLDLAFVITGDSHQDPEVEVSKTVWDDDLGDWVDYIEAEICTIERFNLGIHNTGQTSFIVTRIWDVLPPCLEYADSATVNGISLEPDVIAPPNIEWNYILPADYWWPGSEPNELPPGEWIYIEFDVHVIGPPDIDNINWGYWDVYYNTEYYFFEDDATIYPFEEPWSNHKMHYPQLPDPYGWDVLANWEMPFIPLADDWMCTETGAVTDIHFWGSWYMDMEGIIDGFDISIWDDIHAGQSPSGYSMPGTMLWNEYFTNYEMVPMPPSIQGWYDTFEGWFEPDNHMNYYQYNIVDIIDPFYQTEGTIYWLCIRPNVVGGNGYPFPPLWGWKTSLDHWNDDAVYWREMSAFGWIDLWEPPGFVTSLDLAFVITGEPGPDEVPPAIINVILTTSDPLDTEPGFGWENFTCTVTDNVAVDEVKLVLTGDTTTEYPMTKNGDNYYCNITITTADEYTYHIWANDTSDNENTSTPQPFDLPPNYDVNMDGRAHLQDFVLVAGHYGEYGPYNGWIREDVNNDGRAHLQDFVLIAGHYGEYWK